MQVNENDLASFLEEKRKEGYSLLGVEQASGSIMLDQFIFPSKCLLLLGTSSTLLVYLKDDGLKAEMAY